MATTDKQQSLQDFDFDEPTEFFGVKVPTESQTSAVIKEVKNNTTSNQSVQNTSKLPPDFDNEEDGEEEVTFFGEEPEKKPKEEGSKETPKSKDDASQGDEDIKEGKEENNEEDEETKKEVKQTKEKKDKANQEGNKEEGEENDDGESQDTAEEKEVKFYTQLTEELKENGVFSAVEIKKGEKVNLQKFFELQADEVEARVDEAFEGFFEELKNDKDAVDFIQFKRHGGKTENFFRTYAKRTEIDLTNFDENNEAQVKKIIHHYLTNISELEPEDVEDTYKTLVDSGKHKTRATTYFKKLQALQQQQENDLIENTKKEAEKREKQAQEFKVAIQEVVDSVESVGVLPINKTEKRQLLDYITRPTVKAGKSFIPQFQADLAAILSSTKEDKLKDLIGLAKIIKNKFDVKDLKAKTETQVVKRVKSRLMEAKENPRGRSTGANSTKIRSLADEFE